MCAFERGRFPGDIGEKFFNISDRIWHFGTDLIKNGFFWIKLNASGCQAAHYTDFRPQEERKITLGASHQKVRNKTDRADATMRGRVQPAAQRTSGKAPRKWAKRKLRFRFFKILSHCTGARRLFAKDCRDICIYPDAFWEGRGRVSLSDLFPAGRFFSITRQ